MKNKLLEIKKLNITFTFNNQIVEALKNSNFHIFPRRMFGNSCGESGSGKSVTALSIMKLIRSNSQLKISGNVNFEKKTY